MRHSLLSLFLLAGLSCAYADDKPVDSKPDNAAERTAKKASKGMESTANRAGSAVGRGLNSAEKWVSRTGEKTGKAVDNTANKASSWVKKKTE
jgi:hypothetical protein